MATILERETTGRPGGRLRAASLLILAGILLVAGYLRFTGLDWDEGQYIHPDEGHMRNTVSLIRWPDDLSLYFDTHRSPLNVRNHGGRRYSYGTLPLFAARALAEWIDQACVERAAPLARMAAGALVGPDVEACTPGTFTGIHNAVVGRALSALSDLGTLILIYLMGRRVYGTAAGLLAAGFGAVAAFMIQQAHFFTVDSMACFFVTLVAYLSVRAGLGGGAGQGTEDAAGVRWVDFALAGLSVGLAAACKVSAATSALLVVLAAGQCAVRRVRGGMEGTEADTGTGFELASVLMPLLALVLAGLLSGVAFRVGQPYAFEGPGFLGVEPSPEWFGRLHEIRVEQSGAVDLPSGRQWTNRLTIVFPWLNIVIWGLGFPLGLAAWIGWGVGGYELFSGRRRGRRHVVLWGWFTVVFLYHATRWVMAMRYFLPLYPVLLIFAAAWLVRLGRSASTWKRAVGLGLSGAVSLGAVLWGLAVFTIYLRPHPRIAASRWIFQNVPSGSTVANEHWDWGLPLRIEGRDPFGGMYRGFEMELYNEDTPEMRQGLYRWLDDADWIFLASNRLYASIPRLPARYPLTTEYYRALFAGELGFDLAADFTSYPALGPVVFPDQENPFPLMEADHANQERPVTVRLPAAEESFSVYDHPRVLIFRKTDAYSSDLVERVLGRVELDRVHQGRTPRQATKAPDLLRFDRENWADQQAGGTWSDMFNRDGLINRNPGLAAVAWWLCVTVLGWLAFPLLFASLPWLRDRGYGFARLLALLAIAYLTWLAASLRVLPNTRATIAGLTAVLAVAGAGTGWRKRDELRAFVEDRWRMLLAVEGLFALLFVLWIGVRMVQPDLWHPVVGGEKPMDFAYLNATMKSTWFPPYNPWLSGTWINYYYFGFVIVGTLIKLIGTVPGIAYNLAVPLLFALTGVGAFSAAYNLSGGDGDAGGRRRALVRGMAAVAFMVLIGNLGVVHLIRNRLIEIGGVSFPSTIPGLPNTVSFLRGLWRVVIGGKGLIFRPETWYWHPTRIIPAEAGNPIAEFPAFTFLYGDLHAHMIAFPLTLFALALAIAWVRASRPTWGSLLLGGLVIGALRPTNTWDYPTYLLIGVVALGLGAWRASDENSVRQEGGRLSSLTSRLGAFARRAVWSIPVLVGLTMLLYLPYIRHYVAGYTSFQLWEGARTPAQIYLWIYGGLLLPTVTRLVIEAARRIDDGRRDRVVVASIVAAALALGVALFLWGVPVAAVAAPVAGLAVGLLLALANDGVSDETGDSRATGAAEQALWLMVAVAMALSMGVEVIVLKGDVGRMNTVFKFYLQVWILLSVAAAASLSWLWRQTPRWRVSWGRVWWALMAALAAGGALFLPFGVRARAADRIAPETGVTLDGTAFMKHATVHDGPEVDMRDIALSGDYQAIRWMQETIEGSPVIMEGLGRREYLWANRVSVYTGLPTVVGWRWHQVQQRSGVGGDMVAWRRDDVNICYATGSIAEAERILERYGVRYVVVGPYERAYYGPVGLAKFDRMAEQDLLRVAYDADGVTIYEVSGGRGVLWGDRVS